MRIDILTVLPGLLEGPFSHSILKRAQEKNLASIHIHNIRDWSLSKHKSVDDYAFGGGAGMVLMIEPIARCIDELRSQRDYDEIIYMSPDGEIMDQPMVNRFSLLQNLMIICGHYKGIDERLREHYITREISIGNFVVSGGELPAAIFTDAVIRLLPGVMNDETSALSDSFQDGLIAPPVYTRPAEYKGWKVPDVLMSGNQAEIDKWRHEKSVERTRERRPGMEKE